MKLNLFVKGPAEPVEGHEYPQATKGPLWCEITFVGDGTQGTVEFFFEGSHWIYKAERLAKMKTELLEKLEQPYRLSLPGETLCDGKSIIFTTEVYTIEPWRMENVTARARELGCFIHDWAEPPPPDWMPSHPIHKSSPELEERIRQAKEYQKRVRQGLEKPEVSSSDDPEVRAALAYWDAKEAEMRERNKNRPPMRPPRPAPKIQEDKGSS